MFSRIRYALLLLIALSACSGRPVAISHTPEESPVRNNLVYVDNHGWHTGFIIPAPEAEAALPFLKGRFSGRPPYYEIGWGDKGFYQSHEITTGLTLRALFWSTGSVVHVVAVPQSPYAYFPDSQIIPVALSGRELADLQQYLQSSFVRAADGNVITLQTGLYGDSQFYEGNGTYHILNTCNKWTARGLKSTGMDIATPFKLTAGSIMEYLRPSRALPAGRVFRK